jgi:hypothetical protein
MPLVALEDYLATPSQRQFLTRLLLGVISRSHRSAASAGMRKRVAA